MSAPRHEIHWTIKWNIAKKSYLLCFIKLSSITEYVARAISKGITRSVQGMYLKQNYFRNSKITHPVIATEQWA